MRNILLGIVIALIIVFGLRYCEYKKEEKEQIRANTELIEKQLQNVGKLIVTEGNYSQVFSFEDSKKFYFDIFSSKKKALVIVNAKASIAYDLSKVKTRIDQETETVTIESIPEPELSIHPDIEYYDIQQGYFNTFEAADYNKIRQRIEDSMYKKIQTSNLVGNAKNRLISELQKIYILTNSMGWKLQFKEEPILNAEGLNDIKL